ncbi:MAG: tetratricopeptide repeat protein [Cyclobacteriaceae bacterium]|nr:tetratricopeptide repeat protein [Cyclobacteriaceae bacterium]
MINKRISILESFLKSEPEDPFNWYGLAMEYKAIDPVKCKEYLNHLLEYFPSYLATYYQVAELLIEQSKTNEAEEVLEKGITLARSQDDKNTLRELQNLLNNMLFDND